MFRIWLESSLDNLYQSAVDAFPDTTKRQHAVSPIQITHTTWTPYLGVRTLFIKGKAVNEDRQYNPMILFKRVNYNTENGIPFISSDGQNYTVEKMSLANQNVLLRCECGDFYWRFNYYDWVDKSLWGNKRKKYEAKTDRGPINPMEMPGMCKHLMSLSIHLQEIGLFTSVRE